MNAFHFLRPWWLLVLIVVVALFLRNWRRASNVSVWQPHVSEHLLPLLLRKTHGASGRLTNGSVLLALILVVLALAGPTYEKLPSPVNQRSDALVIVLNLGPSMSATDISPSRLVRGKLKIRDLLKRRKDGQTALVAYAGDAHVVTPLTQDGSTIDSLLDALDASVMPVPGEQPQAGVAEALKLLQSTDGGSVLLLTGEMTTEQADAITALRSELPFRLSILAVGGPNADFNSLSQLAADMRGTFTSITPGDEDLQGLEKSAQMQTDRAEDAQSRFDQWADLGPYLLLLALPFLLILFRRGATAALLILPLVIAVPKASHADLWHELWTTKEQKIQERRVQGVSEYKSGKFEAAAKTLEGLDDAVSLYNRGNALAKAGKIDDAIASYEKALTKQKDFEDARFNKELLKKMKQQQEQEQKEKQQKEKQDEKEQQQEKPQDQQEKQDDQKGDQKDEKKNDKQEQADKADDNKEKKQDSKLQKQKEEQEAQQRKDEQIEAKESEKQGQDEKELQYWLDKIADDPSGLLRRKFLLESRKRQMQREDR